MAAVQSQDIHYTPHMVITANIDVGRHITDH